MIKFFKQEGKMSNRNPDRKNTAKNNKKQKIAIVDDSPMNLAHMNPQAIQRYVAKLPPAQRKKFLDTFNTLYIDEQ
jgi:ABC-type transporter MlaC component